jgi:hypothetical protein
MDVDTWAVRRQSFVAIDGDVLAVGSVLANDSLLRVYERSGSSWQLAHRERFESMEPLVIRDGHLVVRATPPRIYEKGDDGWRVAGTLATHPARDESEGEEWRAQSTDVDGSLAIASFYNRNGRRGAEVDIYHRKATGQWKWEAPLEPPPEVADELSRSVFYQRGCQVEWGQSVALAGERAMVSLVRTNCPHSGVAAYVFERNGERWEPLQVVDFPHDIQGVGNWVPLNADGNDLIMGTILNLAVATYGADGRYDAPRAIETFVPFR